MSHILMSSCMREALTVSSVGDSSLFLSSRMLSSDPTWSRISSHRFRRNSRAQVSYKSPPSRTQASLPLKSPPRPKVSFMTKVSSWTKGLLLHQRILKNKVSPTKSPPWPKYFVNKRLLLDKSLLIHQILLLDQMLLLLDQRSPSRPKVSFSTKGLLLNQVYSSTNVFLEKKIPTRHKSPTFTKKSFWSKAP